MTLLSVIQEFAIRTGIPKPSSVALSRDDQALQCMGLLNEVLDDLGERKAWSLLKQEATFASIATEDQGLMTTLASAGFEYIIDDKLYNRTERRVIDGPISAEEWQAKEAGFITMAFTRYRLRLGHLYLYPVPTTGSTIAFEYISSYPVRSSLAEAKSYFTADYDTSIYPERLLIAGLRWKWRSEKGLRYAEHFRAYEAIVANLSGKDGGHRPIDLSGEKVFSGIVVPDSNWLVP